MVVDWRDALPESGEPNKLRPGVVVGRSEFFDEPFGFVMVVPLTGDARLRIDGATVDIEPSPENRCVKRCYALAWNVQTVPKRRARLTEARISPAQLSELRDQIARLIER